MWKPVLFLLILTAAAGALPPTPQGNKQAQGPLRLPSENDALALALADAKTLGDEAPFFRYLWIETGEADGFRLASDWLAKLSRSAVIHRPVPLGRDKLQIVRVDLRLYAPRAADLQDWIAAWELLRFDPRFNRLVTKDTLRLLSGEELGRRTVKREQTKRVRSKRTGKLVTKTVIVEDEEETLALEVGRESVVRLPARHVDQGMLGELIGLTGSQAPLVTASYFQTRALTQIQGVGIFKVIYSGLYYRLAGIKKGVKGQSDEDRWFQEHVIGADNVTAKQVYDRLRSDQRVAIFRSDVTGKPRRVDFFHGPQSRDNQGSVSITHDPRDQDIDLATHPLHNVFDFKDAAREVIWDRANGMHGYALFNGQGALQDEVPPDIAVNHRIPAPYTKRLQPAQGCIDCHERDGQAGWQPLRSDLKEILSFIGDRDPLRRLNPDLFDRRAGLYEGTPTKWLSRGRDDYSASTLKATGILPGGKGDQSDVVQLAATRTSAAFAARNYEQVDARRALRDLAGIELEQPTAVAKLRELLPLKPEARLDGEIVDDPRVVALLSGLSIGRVDYDLAYGFIAARMRAK